MEKSASSILIADDTDEIRDLLACYLKDTPFAAVYARDGIEAMAACRKFRISMIFLDMEMPVMDGYTAARAIKSMPGMTAVPLIAMTSHEGRDEVEKCLRAGCTSYLRKPVSRDAFLESVALHMSSRPMKCPVERDSGEEAPVVHIGPDVARLAPRYLENRKRDTEIIAGLLDAGKLSDVRIIGHSMAGSAGGYGFEEIGLIGKAIEEAALRADAEEVAALNRRLAAYLTHVVVIGLTG